MHALTIYGDTLKRTLYTRYNFHNYLYYIIYVSFISLNSLGIQNNKMSDNHESTLKVSLNIIN